MLIGYITLVEPYLTLGNQARLWAAGYAILAGLLVACAAAVWRALGRQQNARKLSEPVSELAMDRSGVCSIEPAHGRDDLFNDGFDAGTTAVGDPAHALFAQLHHCLCESPRLGPPDR